MKKYTECENCGGSGEVEAEPFTTKHTPGPWLIASSTTVYALQDTNPRTYNPDGSIMQENSFSFNVQGKISDEEKAANAQLLATAPEMLEVIKDLLQYAEAYYSDDAELSIEKAKRLIKKATE